MVFPLPINAIEHYMLADDSADYPRCFFLVVRLHRPLDESRLQRAIEVATKRHPLLRALIEYDGDRPRRWIECADPRHAIEWKGDSAGLTGDSERWIAPIDLRHAPGLRFRVHHDTQGDALCIEFHHAATDGLGAIQFVGDLLAVYAADSSGGEATLPPLDPNLLAGRNRFGLTGWRRIVRWLYGSVGWLVAIEFVLHRPAPLGILPTEKAADGVRASGFCTRTFGRGETAALLRMAKDERVTVNDLLMRDTFLAIQGFVERHWPGRARDHKRIMVPTNLRVAGDERLPAANVVAMVNLDRRPHRWTETHRLLRVLHWELSLVKRLRLGVIFVLILEQLHALFGSLRRFLPTDRCQATCVVSNLGPVLGAVEPRVIRGIEFYPPIRPLTSAAFGVLTHDGQMTVSLHYDAAALAAEQGAELIDRLLEKLRGYGGIECNSTPQPTAGDEVLEDSGRDDLLRSHS